MVRRGSTAPYDADTLAQLSEALRRTASSVDAWCVFDNTASGAALENAWELVTLVDGDGRGPDEARTDTLD